MARTVAALKVRWSFPLRVFCDCGITSRLRDEAEPPAEPWKTKESREQQASRSFSLPRLQMNRALSMAAIPAPGLQRLRLKPGAAVNLA